ncbi:MAG: hypothetical protein QOJ18_753 [Microbacteriaceae bacterium]|jgi:hypothetical protein|nr:hypothetical protein [Microbacteriaceae bacterium]MDQ1606386.1 hypothetical protein [Microbacteriaceae bacterium]
MKLGLQAEELSARDASILEFERQWWKHAGAKEEAIRAKFGLSAARYYQILNAVLETPAAIVSDPMLVKRLRRLRDSRTAARSARIVGTADPRDSTDRSGPGEHELNN